MARIGLIAGAAALALVAALLLFGRGLVALFVQAGVAVAQFLLALLPVAH
jgi:Flp pilus assembly pilin Flp